MRHEDLNLARLPVPPRPHGLRRRTAPVSRIVRSLPREAGGVVVEHPNRAKASSKATRAVVVALLLGSAFLLALISLGAWDALMGAQALQLLYVVAYVGIAVLVLRWNRGVLPVAAALAIVLAVFAVVSVPGWFERDSAGFDQPAIPADVVGLLTALLVPLQLLLVAFAMRGFGQAWNVEVEQHADPPPRDSALPA